MHANQWRISDDFWDTDWASCGSSFTRLHDWTPFRGPGHFPDADMLPVGMVRMWSMGGMGEYAVYVVGAVYVD